MRCANLEAELLKGSLENVHRDSVAADNMAHKTNIVQPEIFPSVRKIRVMMPKNQ